MTTLRVLSILAALTTATGAQAQLGAIDTPTVRTPALERQSAERPLPSFNALDANDDRVISQSEAAADRIVSRNFMRADSNRDRELSRPEYLALQQARRR